ncbi:MAG: hypothetical protein EOO68_35140, partial [Moraxellaceae bacterium]
CPAPKQKHQSHFLICERCGIAVELDNPELNRTIMGLSEAAGFRVNTHSIEIIGVCSSCEAGLTAQKDDE